MKANAPEKLYFGLQGDTGILDIYSKRESENDIEYIRTNAFIDKAWDWIEDNMLSSNQQDKSLIYYEQFKNYIKGE